MEFKFLIIFLTNGETLFFNSIKNFHEFEGNLIFDYWGKTTKNVNKGIFNLNKLLGYSVGK